MPEISVDCFVRYNPSRDVNWNQDEWAAVHVKKIVKGEALQGRFFFPVNGVLTEINRNNLPIFGNALGRIFARRISTKYGSDITIVPVPNGHACIDDLNDFQTYRIAKKIARHIGGAIASDVLRWRKPMGKAHAGGRRRDLWQHKQDLVVAKETDRKIVLFDDVVTTGAQLAAARHVLTQAGYDVVGQLAVLDVIEKDMRGDPMGWRSVTRHPMDVADFFEEL